MIGGASRPLALAAATTVAALAAATVPAAATLARHQPRPRATPAIVGGAVAPGRTLQAAARWAHRCSGVLVAPSFVLIAAHCVDEPPTVKPADAIGTRVLIGNPRHRVQRRTVGRVTLAPQTYPPPLYSPDLALLRLTHPATIKPVGLPSSAARARTLQTPGSPLQIAGFGETAATSGAARESTALHEAAMQLVSCASSSPTLDPALAPFLDCAQPASAAELGAPPGSACAGDSGGPALTIAGRGRVLIALVVGADTDAGCAPGSPILLARIDSAYRWLTRRLHADRKP